MSIAYSSLSGPSAGTSGRQTYQAFDAHDLDHNVELAARLRYEERTTADGVPVQTAPQS